MSQPSLLGVNAQIQGQYERDQQRYESSRKLINLIFEEDSTAAGAKLISQLRVAEYRTEVEAAFREYLQSQQCNIQWAGDEIGNS